MCKGRSAYSEWWTYDEVEGYFNKLLDHVTVKPRLSALDAKVQKILDGDVDYQAFLRRNKEMDSLRQGFNDHHNAILHSFWEIKGLGAIGVDEPPKGKHDPESHDKYLALLSEITGAPRRTSPSSDAIERLEAARRKLDNKHETWMKEHSRPPTRLEGWSPENE